MTERERMDAGLLYDAMDDTVFEEQLNCLEAQYDYNMTRPKELEKRLKMLKGMLGSCGENCYIEPPLHSNWGGKHLFVGEDFYANFNLTVVDDANIYIGNHAMIGPNVTIATANHPILPELRATGVQYNREVHIGNNVWLGAGVVIVPGITIGDNAVIGAGSIVTKDIPANVIAVGNPCKVLREIGEEDRMYFYKKEKIDWDYCKGYMKEESHVKE